MQAIIYCQIKISPFGVCASSIHYKNSKRYHNKNFSFRTKEIIVDTLNRKGFNVVKLEPLGESRHFGVTLEKRSN